MQEPIDIGFLGDTSALEPDAADLAPDEASEEHLRALLAQSLRNIKLFSDEPWETDIYATVQAINNCLTPDVISALLKTQLDHWAHTAPEDSYLGAVCPSLVARATNAKAVVRPPLPSAATSAASSVSGVSHASDAVPDEAMRKARRARWPSDTRATLFDVRISTTPLPLSVLKSDEAARQLGVRFVPDEFVGRALFARNDSCAGLSYDAADLAVVVPVGGTVTLTCVSKEAGKLERVVELLVFAALSLKLEAHLLRDSGCPRPPPAPEAPESDSGSAESLVSDVSGARTPVAVRGYPAWSAAAQLWNFFTLGSQGAVVPAERRRVHSEGRPDESSETSGRFERSVSRGYAGYGTDTSGYDASLTDAPTTPAARMRRSNTLTSSIYHTPQSHTQSSPYDSPRSPNSPDLYNSMPGGLPYETPPRVRPSTSQELPPRAAPGVRLRRYSTTSATESADEAGRHTVARGVTRLLSRLQRSKSSRMFKNYFKGSEHKIPKNTDTPYRAEASRSRASTITRTPRHRRSMSSRTKARASPTTDTNSWERLGTMTKAPRRRPNERLTGLGIAGEDAIAEERRNDDRFQKVIRKMGQCILSISPTVYYPPPHILVRLRQQELDALAAPVDSAGAAATTPPCVTPSKRPGGGELTEGKRSYPGLRFAAGQSSLLARRLSNANASHAPTLSVDTAATPRHSRFCNCPDDTDAPAALGNIDAQRLLIGFADGKQAAENATSPAVRQLSRFQMLHTDSRDTIKTSATAPLAKLTAPKSTRITLNARAGLASLLTNNNSLSGTIRHQSMQFLVEALQTQTGDALPLPCCPPKWLDIDFYDMGDGLNEANQEAYASQDRPSARKAHDVPLGHFVSLLVRNRDGTCRAAGCAKPEREHTLVYMHSENRIVVRLHPVAACSEVNKNVHAELEALVGTKETADGVERSGEKKENDEKPLDEKDISVEKDTARAREQSGEDKPNKEHQDATLENETKSTEKDSPSAVTKSPRIIMWTTCAECKARSPPQVMSSASYLFSFTKYLELLLYDRVFGVPAGLCEHGAASADMSDILAAKQRHIQCFYLDGQVLTVSLASLNLYELRLPTAVDPDISSSVGEEKTEDSPESTLTKQLLEEIKLFYASTHERCREFLKYHESEVKFVRSRSGSYNADSGSEMLPPEDVQVRDSTTHLLEQLEETLSREENELLTFISFDMFSEKQINNGRAIFMLRAQAAELRLQEWQAKHFPESLPVIDRKKKAPDGEAAAIPPAKYTVPDYFGEDVHVFPNVGSSVLVREKEYSSWIALALSAAPFREQVAALAPSMPLTLSKSAYTSALPTTTTKAAGTGMEWGVPAPAAQSAPVGDNPLRFDVGAPSTASAETLAAKNNENTFKVPPAVAPRHIRPGLPPEFVHPVPPSPSPSLTSMASAMEQSKKVHVKPESFDPDDPYADFTEAVRQRAAAAATGEATGELHSPDDITYTARPKNLVSSSNVFLETVKGLTKQKSMMLREKAAAGTPGTHASLSTGFFGRTVSEESAGQPALKESVLEDLVGGAAPRVAGLQTTSVPTASPEALDAGLLEDSAAGQPKAVAPGESLGAPGRAEASPAMSSSEDDERTRTVSSSDASDAGETALDHGPAETAEAADVKGTPRAEPKTLDVRAPRKVPSLILAASTIKRNVSEPMTSSIVSETKLDASAPTPVGNAKGKKRAHALRGMTSTTSLEQAASKYAAMGAAALNLHKPSDHLVSLGLSGMTTPSVDEEETLSIIEEGESSRSSYINLVGEEPSLPLPTPDATAPHFVSGAGSQLWNLHESLSTVEKSNPTNPAKPQEASGHVKFKFRHGSKKFQVTAWHAHQFLNLRRKFGLSESLFIESLSRCNELSTSGGKSKAAFWITRDNRFILKELKTAWGMSERDAFLHFAPHLLDYLMRPEHPSLMAKIFGFYTIKRKDEHTGHVIRHDVVVMENLFHAKHITRQYDLKGVASRVNEKSAGEQRVTGWDGDWLSGTSLHARLLIYAHSKTLLMDALLNDTRFLSQAGNIDYSLLVGVDDAHKTLVVGLIDTLGVFNTFKMLENAGKTALKKATNNDIDDVTVLPPSDYAHRFRQAMEKYFVAVPEKFSKPPDGVPYSSDPRLAKVV